ncbi:MAG: hypothetical protein LBM08_05035 [Dysgonamonadaceae bacterium]|jgi:hypothetical protein|nr:hypothetical protein [Dysgonamonadaceae bacterium]
MRTQTSFNGISTTSVYQEGDCHSLVNLRKKNGAMLPVSPRGMRYEIGDQYDLIFIHETPKYKNWIGVKNHSGGNSDIYYWKEDEGQFTIPIKISLAQVNNVNDIEQTGNILSLITGNGIQYLLYDKDEYNFLGKFPELKNIKYLIVPKDVSKFYGEVFGFIDDSDDNSISETYSKALPISLLKERSIAIFNKVVNELDNMFFSDAHLMIFAFRLYDGSLVKASMPVLLTNPNYSESEVSFLWYPVLENQIMNARIRTGVGVGDKEAATINIRLYRVFLDFDLSYLENWRDVIQSVDVFISKGLGYFSENNFRDLKYEDLYLNEGGHASIFGSYPLLLDQSKMIDGLDSALFYHMYSIEIGEKNSITFSSIENPTQGQYSFPKKDYLNNLIYNELLSVDAFSNHSISSKSSYVYNSRVHIANVKNILFNGWSYDFGNMFRLKDALPTYNGFRLIDYMQYSYPRSIGSVALLLIAVDLKIDGREETVISQYETQDLPTYFWMNPYFAYPDTRAFRARFYWSTGVSHYKIHEIELKPSFSMNLAYYISTTGDKTKVMPPIPNVIQSIQPEQLPSAPAEHFYMYPVVEHTEPNKLKVSALNNPFVFPNATTYILGSGTILNMNSVAIRISEGQFGQYPLYVFTNEGIYSLQVGQGEVVYSNQSAPVSYETPSTDIICSTPFGIAFASARGLCIIMGQEVALLSGGLQQAPRELNIQSHPSLEGILLNYGALSFTEYVKQIEFMLYDPHENELIISDKDSDFNYVYSFDSKQFYISTEKVDQVIENSFPELLVCENSQGKTAIKDYAIAGTADTHISLITRPLVFDTPDFKRLERMVLRGTFFDLRDLAGKKPFVLNYFSIDGVNFDILRGIPLPLQSRKDVDMGLFGGSKYRQFIFALGAMVSDKSEIQYLESEVSKEYNNDKMR